MRPFITPLFEVCAEIDFAYRLVIDFPALSFYREFETRLPIIDQFPLLIVPAKDATPEQLEATPPIYRFSSETRRFTVHLGPRMLAANMRQWEGYPLYRSFVNEIVSRYFDLLRDVRVMRYSLGYYNRIALDTIDDIPQILSIPVNIPSGIIPDNWGLQWLQQTDVGNALTQMQILRDQSSENNLMLELNMIIQREHDQPIDLNADEHIAWLDSARDVGKKLFWNTLTKAAQESWKVNVPTGM